MFQTKIRRAAVSTLLVSALSLLAVPNAGAEPRARSNGKGRPASARVAIQSYSLLEFSPLGFLVSLWGKAGSIRNHDAWLLGTLANRCIIYWRKHRSRLWDLVDATILELLADVEAPPQETSDLRFDLDALLANLPDRCRSVLRLRYGFGCSTAEAAEKMGYCSSSIRKVTRRCLAALTEQLLSAGFQPGS